MSRPGEMLRGLGRRALGAVNALVPKRDKAVLSGFPSGEDSVMEIARQLAARGDIAPVLLTDSGVAPEGAAPGITWCRRRSLRGLLHYLTARHVFFTHGLYLSPVPPASQVCVNVWHGMPIKRIGHLIGRRPPSATVILATSTLFRTQVARCFAVPEASVLVTGIPRNDVMVTAAARAGEIKQRLGIGTPQAPGRLLVWLPTFRKAVRGIDRTDGRPHSSIFGMDDMDLAGFVDVLRRHDCSCIVKRHPMAPVPEDRVDGERLRLWSDADLAAQGVSLYQMVGAADLLITDASSVYVDYLLLDRPVVIAFPDFAAYRDSRGFALEPIESYFAGPLARSYPELVAALAEALDGDPHAARRARIAAQFHDRPGGGATARLLDAVCPAPQRRA